MISKITLAALSITVLAPAASAAGAPPSQDNAKQVDTAKVEKKYCLTVEPLTGSRVEKTECKTKRQWAWEGVKVDQLSN